MQLPKILFKGNYTAADIMVSTLAKSTRKIDAKLEQQMQVRWQELLTEAKSSGRKLWDSELYRFEDFRTGPKLELTFSTVPFSVAKAGSAYIDEFNRLGEEYYSKSTFAIGLAKTSDDCYILGEVSSNYMNTGAIDIIGGVLSKSEGLMTNSNDLFAALYKEFEEEIGIKKESLAHPRLLGAILTMKFKVCLVFHLEISLTKNEVQDIYDENKDDELSRIIFIHENKLKEELTKLPDFRSTVVDLLD